ncbi:pyruvate kinase PKM [Cotesia typhae]|uniref:pyruvate kinase PKM n=1 Tax=Cotesia typhae TaxID=2053667 RepID=UPI003D692DA5
MSKISSNLKKQSIMKLEEQVIPERQLDAAYQCTRIDHEIKLNINCKPSPARLTRIIITLSDNNIQIEDIAKVINNVDIVRLNVSHGDQNWHRKAVNNLLGASEQLRTQLETFNPPSVALDLRGPEIRAKIFKDNPNPTGDTILVKGNHVNLLADSKIKPSGKSSSLWTSCPELPRASQVGDRIILDRGAVSLSVDQTGEDYIKCKVMNTGRLSQDKIIQAIDTSSLELPGISEKDDADIDLALELECHFLIVSHVRTSKTISAVKKRIEESSTTHSICVLAKISSSQGVDNFDDILRVADGVVIDREGLQVDIGSEKIFLAQKSMIAKCVRVGKPAILTHRVSTTDVKVKLDLDLLANAILEGVDGIFLATGSVVDMNEHVKIIEDVDLVCREAESARWQRQIFHELSYKITIPTDSTHGVVIAAVELSMKLNTSGIIVTTTTGRSAMLLSIYRPRCPVVAVTRHQIVSQCLRIYFAIHPIHYTCETNSNWNEDIEARVKCGMNYLRQSSFVKVGDPVVVVGGWRTNDQGFTNSIRVVYVSLPPITSIGDDFEETW